MSTKRIARMYISGVIFFALPHTRLITTYEIHPTAIPSEMLYMSGIAISARYAGTASVRSLKSISTTADTIRNPTKIRAGAVANPGIVVNTGARKIETRKRNPVTTDESPVLPPSATPAELSTNVVVVDVPSTALLMLQLHLQEVPA